MENNKEGKLVIFRIGKEEFGIYIENIREIVRIPVITTVPGNPSFILGICNLRGNVVPVIDAKARFNKSAETEISDQTRMLVIDHRGQLTGFVIDSVSEVTVIERDSVEEPPRMSNSSGIDRKFLSGVVKLKENGRVVLIINIEEILKVSGKHIEKSSGLKGASEALQSSEIKPVEEETLVTFSSGKEEFGFNISNVREILRVDKIVAVPEAPDYVRGILSVRERLLPVVDFRKYMGMESLVEEYVKFINLVKEDYTIFLADIKNSLDKNIPFSGVLDPRESSFWKWLDTFSSGNEVLSEMIQKIRDAHRKLYEGAKKAISLYQMDKNSGHQFYAKNIGSLGSQLNTLLDSFIDAIEKHISADQRILVVQAGGILIGVMVDHVEEVLSIEKKFIDKTVSIAQEVNSDLTGIAKIDNGERLIMIIDGSSILKGGEKDFMSKLNKNRVDREDKNQSVEIEQLVTFNVSNEEFGIVIMHVQEINRMPKITKLPKSPEFIEGVINLRGEIVPVIDLRQRFGLEKKEADDRSRVVVVDVLGKKTGLVVDSVNEVLRLPKSNIEPSPEILALGAGSEFIEAVGKKEDSSKIVMILDIDKILTKTEQEEYSRMEAEVPEDAAEEPSESPKSVVSKELKIEE